MPHELGLIIEDVCSVPEIRDSLSSPLKAKVLRLEFGAEVHAPLKGRDTTISKEERTRDSNPLQLQGAQFGHEKMHASFRKLAELAEKNRSVKALSFQP